MQEKQGQKIWKAGLQLGNLKEHLEGVLLLTFRRGFITMIYYLKMAIFFLSLQKHLLTAFAVFSKSAALKPLLFCQVTNPKSMFQIFFMATPQFYIIIYVSVTYWWITNHCNI